MNDGASQHDVDGGQKGKEKKRDDAVGGLGRMRLVAHECVDVDGNSKGPKLDPRGRGVYEARNKVPVDGRRGEPLARLHKQLPREQLLLEAPCRALRLASPRAGRDEHAR